MKEISSEKFQMYLNKNGKIYIIYSIYSENNLCKNHNVILNLNSKLKIDKHSFASINFNGSFQLLKMSNYLKNKHGKEINCRLLNLKGKFCFHIFFFFD